MTGTLNPSFAKRRLGAMAQMELHKPRSKVNAHDGTRPLGLLRHQPERRFHEAAITASAQSAKHLVAMDQDFRHVGAGGGCKTVSRHRLSPRRRRHGPVNLRFDAVKEIGQALLVKLQILAIGNLGICYMDRRP